VYATLHQNDKLCSNNQLQLLKFITLALGPSIHTPITQGVLSFNTNFAWLYPLPKIIQIHNLSAVNQQLQTVSVSARKLLKVIASCQQFNE